MQQQRLALHKGKIVQWEDPDAGHHADGCPAERETYYIGPIDRIVVRDGTTWVHMDGGVKTTPDDDNLQEPDEWLETMFEESEYDRFMWYEEHWDDEYVNHDDYPCDWPCDFDSSDIERRTDGQ